LEVNLLIKHVVKKQNISKPKFLTYGLLTLIKNFYPMKYLSTLVIFTCLTLQFGFSQVKKQYVDEQSASTTVVVKEDDASDIDILNSQFDINSIGIGQVIKIKTEKTPLNENTTVALAEVPTTKTVSKPKVVKEATQPAREVAALPKARKAPSEKYYKGVGKSRKVKTKRKRLKKRKRLRKRKRRKRGCPTF